MLTAILPAMALAAWSTSEPQVTKAASSPSYEGIKTRLLDGDLVDFRVAVSGDAITADASDYAECAAAQYTLIRGYLFALHLRTSVEEDAGLLTTDAVYTISSDLPRGTRTIDAEVTVAACGQSGIPTV